MDFGTAPLPSMGLWLFSGAPPPPPPPPVPPTISVLKGIRTRRRTTIVKRHLGMRPTPSPFPSNLFSFPGTSPPTPFPRQATLSDRCIGRRGSQGLICFPPSSPPDSFPWTLFSRGYHHSFEYFTAVVSLLFSLSFPLALPPPIPPSNTLQGLPCRLPFYEACPESLARPPIPPSACPLLPAEERCVTEAMVSSLSGTFLSPVGCPFPPSPCLMSGPAR